MPKFDKIKSKKIFDDNRVENTWLYANISRLANQATFGQNQKCPLARFYCILNTNWHQYAWSEHPKKRPTVPTGQDIDTLNASVDM